MRNFQKLLFITFSKTNIKQVHFCYCLKLQSVSLQLAFLQLHRCKAALQEKNQNKKKLALVIKIANGQTFFHLCLKKGYFMDLRLHACWKTDFFNYIQNQIMNQYINFAHTLFIYMLNTWFLFIFNQFYF